MSKHAGDFLHPNLTLPSNSHSLFVTIEEHNGQKGVVEHKHFRILPNVLPNAPDELFVEHVELDERIFEDVIVTPVVSQFRR